MGDIILMAPRPHPTWFHHQPYSSVLYIVCFVLRCCSSVKRGLYVSIIPCFCALRLLFNKRNLICQAIHFAQTFSATVVFKNYESQPKEKKKKNDAQCDVKYTRHFFRRLYFLYYYLWCLFNIMEIALYQLSFVYACMIKLKIFSYDEYEINNICYIIFAISVKWYM